MKEMIALDTPVSVMRDGNDDPEMPDGAGYCDGRPQSRGCIAFPVAAIEHHHAGSDQRRLFPRIGHDGETSLPGVPRRDLPRGAIADGMRQGIAGTLGLERVYDPVEHAGAVTQRDTVVQDALAVPVACDPQQRCRNVAHGLLT